MSALPRFHRTVADATTDALSARDFARLADHLHAITGIKMPPGKRTMLEGRLRRRVRATDTGSLDGYCAWLFAGDNMATEQTHIVNAVTTNTTAFFREPGHFDHIRQAILPDMARAGVRDVRAWSAACSTGAEPYTLAMVLDAYAKDVQGPRFSVLATDVDTEMLETARRGIYPAEAVEQVPPGLRTRYVLKAKREGRDDVRIAPRLRAAIAFAQLNLMDDQYPVGAPMDLIFCRNVLIYFDRATQQRVVRRLVDCLAPGGYLFLGHSESITGFDLPLVAVATTVFRRR